VIKDFYGETAATEKQFEHVEDMIHSFMKPIEEMSENEESDKSRHGYDGESETEVRLFSGSSPYNNSPEKA
jgi:hypothetical protein